MNNQHFADALWSQGPITPQNPVLDRNLIMNTDSYKPSHYLFLPDYVEHMSWYLESRGVASDRTWDKAMYFGLQMFLKEYLSKPITMEMIDEADEMLGLHFNSKHLFNRHGWETILNEYGGYLPLQVDAAPEGLVFPLRNIMARVVNTDPRFPWLPGYMEKAFVQATWYPVTVATLSWHIKQTIKKFLLETSDNPGKLEDLMWFFRLHDFGARGVSSLESSGLGGISHLVNFRGTDTLEALRYGRKYYHEEMAGYSIPATEHSIVLAHVSEYEAYNQVISHLSPGGMVASVSDTYDLFRTIDWYGTRLKKKIVESGGTLVVRPDSGEPTEIVPAVIKRLMAHFGYETNSKGYDVLPPYIRVIQGDGVNENSIHDILEVVKERRYSTENLTFGMGGKLLQGVDRDTLKFAMKPSAIWDRHAREWRGVSKDPITDPGKRSKMGRLSLVHEKGKFATVDTSYVERDESRVDLLRPVFRNGEILVEHTLDRVRERSEALYC